MRKPMRNIARLLLWISTVMLCVACADDRLSPSTPEPEPDLTPLEACNDARLLQDFRVPREEIRPCLAKQRCAWPMVVAHRGIRNYGAPENSLQSLRDTAAAGVPFAEVDVRRSADGKMVLMHDATVQRTTDGEGKVEDLSWAELRELKLRSSDDQHHTIPSFDEALALIQELGLALYVDLKDADDTELLTLLEAYDAWNWALIRKGGEQPQRLYDADPRVWLLYPVDSVEEAQAFAADKTPTPLVEVSGTSSPLLAEALNEAGFTVQIDVMVLGDLSFVARRNHAAWNKLLLAPYAMLQSDQPHELQRALCLRADAAQQDAP